MKVAIKVYVYGACRNDLHIVDGELSQPKLPLIPDHEIVGRVAALGAGTFLCVLKIRRYRRSVGPTSVDQDLFGLWLSLTRKTS